MSRIEHFDKGDTLHLSVEPIISFTSGSADINLDELEGAVINFIRLFIIENYVKKEESVDEKTHEEK